MAFMGLLPDQILIEPYVSSDGYGNPQFGAPVAYRCRIAGGARDVTNAQGQEVVSNRRIFVSTTAAIDTRSRITLPTRCSPTNPPIIKVEAVSGARDVHHTVIYV